MNSLHVDIIGTAVSVFEGVESESRHFSSVQKTSFKHLRQKEDSVLEL